MLHVHRSERADGLAAALSELLAEPPADPFASEVVVVPTRGMERWLAQTLSRRLGARAGRADGVCANVEFASPRALAADVVAAASGVDPDRDPWLPERAVWPLLSELDECLEEDWAGVLAVHLGHDDLDDAPRHARRFPLARHLAGLYDGYALHRPQMVRAWARGEDVDASGRGLGPDAAWQAELWRRLCARIGTADPARRASDACERLRGTPALVELPGRVALFGLTRLPAGHLEILDALAAGRDVHLFLLHPSPGLWARVEQHELPSGAVRRARDPTAALPANRLLASWGRDAREMQLVIAAAGGEVEHHHHPVGQPERTLLERLQADVRADRPPPEPAAGDAPDPRAPIAPADRSVEIHACHGAARQVEVLRDVICHLLADDPTLEPRDVIVMCPDIETFAPLIHATFGAGRLPDPDGEVELVEARLRPPDLRVRLADRSLRQTNPVLAVVAELLELADQRVSASQVLGLADRAPVRRRFGFGDDDLARLQGWIAESGIRWGLDAAHRAPYRLETLENGTWRAGLSRLLVGVAMSEEDRRLCGGVLPLDDVESGQIDLAGRLAELIDRLGTALRALATPKTAGRWSAEIATAAEALTATAPRDAWQRSALERILGELVDEAGGSQSELALGEVRALLSERLRGRPTRANFRTGHLTVCTLVPMRSVPHRVVCLLGLDDGAFPRAARRDGDDLMLADAHVGDRDARSEDRQLLLDALMAASQRLVITYTGNDERTNAPRPPAVPVGELLDVIERSARTPDGRPARERIVVCHPLQPFDARNFIDGQLAPAGPWSFDRAARDGARALAAPRGRPRPFLESLLPPLEAGIVELDQLVAFVEHPVRAFLRQRLGLYVGSADDEIDDLLAIELDGLEKWAVGQRILEARLAGVDMHAAELAEFARGLLPPSTLAQPVIDEVHPRVQAIVAAAEQAAAPAEAASVDVRVQVPGGPLLSGTVSGVIGDVARTAAYARVAPKHRLAAWVRLLALTAAHPQRPFEAVTIGRGRRNVAVARIAALGGEPNARRERALRELGVLCDLHARGLREPLPIYCQTSAAFAAAGTREQALVNGRREWQSEWERKREDADAAHALVLGDQVDFDELLAVPAGAAEIGEGWDAGEPSRFGRLARRLWAGLLACEEVSER